MTRHLFGLGIWLAAVLPALALEPNANATAAKPQGPDPYALSARIDQHIGARLKEVGAEPAPLADDYEFLRRAMLDLNGRIPLPTEVYEFVNDKDPYKRRKLVDKLLDSPGYTIHFTNIWRTILIPETQTNIEVAYLQVGFDNWVRRQLKENVPYDKMVRTLLTAQIARNQRQYYDPFSGQESPLTFFQAKEGKPENIAAATSRIFMGVNIECAQCHNHPFARWSRDQFWNTAAFFAGIERQGPQFYQPLREIDDRREIAIPNTDKVVQAAFLDGSEPQWKFQTSSRVTLADWLTTAENPFFSRTAVNRMWSQLFGIGIVDPPDDFNDENKPSHPELLDEMAKTFGQAKFDIKFMLRAIMASEAYQRTSKQTHSTQSDPRLFAKMPVRAMTGEQLFDSLATAVSYRDAFRTQSAVFYGGNNPRQEFISRFNANAGKPTEAQTSILQALLLMNGNFVNGATSVDKSETLAAVADAPFMNTSRKIETLFFAALGRKPAKDELDKLVKFVETGDKAKQKQRLGDVFWTLLNTVEFRVNH